jgi:hypothetical protein
MFYVLLPSAALACDLAIFQKVPAPVPEDGGHGVATGEQQYQGMTVVGGNFTRRSTHGVSAWEKVLLDAGSDDEWVPKQFGYDKSEYIDHDHMYLSFNLGFLWDAVQVKRQLVVQVQNVHKADAIQSCWWMIDPTPYQSKVAQWATDVEWERAMFGRWEVTPQSDGGTLVSYQWWTQEGKIPSSILRYAVGHTLPDLLDAFDARVGDVEAGRAR